MKVKGYIFKTKIGKYYDSFANGVVDNKEAAYVYSKEELLEYVTLYWGDKGHGKWSIVWER